MVGALVAGKVGIGSPALYQVACETGMVAAASDIYGKIAALDASPLDLVVTGSALGIDQNADGVLDAVTAGVWVGTVDMPASAAPLASGTFRGQTP